MISRAHDWAMVCCIQQRYTYLRPKPGATFGAQISANDDLLDYVASEGVTLLAYSPLLNGAYTRTDRAFPEQYVGPDGEARLAVLHAIAEETGATANQVIYAWMMQSTPTGTAVGTPVGTGAVIPLMAASNDAQMTENLGALELTLSAAQMVRLTEAGA
jgi:aryl-alcohol dehydrogenase-like predicted oxidoreductase